MLQPRAALRRAVRAAALVHAGRLVRVRVKVRARVRGKG